MALNTSAVQSVAPKKEIIAPEVKEGEILLQLHLYDRYVRMGRLFTKGTIYKFTTSQAMKLLAENDLGRSIWRRYRVPPPVVSPEKKLLNGIVDARDEVLKDQPIGDPLGRTSEGVIEIGNDDEIADILAGVDQDEEVTI